jgi:hypothetical protein
MSTGNLPGSKWLPARKAENFTAIYEPIVWKMWEPRRLKTLWASTACFIFYSWCLLSQCSILDFATLTILGDLYKCRIFFVIHSCR